MKRLILLVCMVFSTLSGTAWAESESCSAVAAQKKLAGAAKTSFLKKCEKDARERCEQAASDKKLAGAARNSFTNKCVNDAVGQRDPASLCEAAAADKKLSGAAKASFITKCVKDAKATAGTEDGAPESGKKDKAEKPEKKG
jgi:hypothetical protein